VLSNDSPIESVNKAIKAIDNEKTIQAKLYIVKWLFSGTLLMILIERTKDKFQEKCLKNISIKPWILHVKA
jgi:hypothetical protein